MPEVEWIGEWKESLLWCPSQLYRKFRVRYEDGTVSPVYTLYLRWRWSDPWSCYVLWEEGEHPRFLTGDLFEEHGFYFHDEEWREAEKAAEQLVERLVKLEKLRVQAKQEPQRLERPS